MVSPIYSANLFFLFCFIRYQFYRLGILHLPLRLHVANIRNSCLSLAFYLLLCTAYRQLSKSWTIFKLPTSIITVSSPILYLWFSATQRNSPPPPPPSYKLIHCLTDCSITFIPFPTTCSLASLVFSSLATTLSLCQYFYEGIIIYFVSLTPVQLSPLRIVI